MSNKPEPAAPLVATNGRDSQFDSWLFRFWSWVTTKLQAFLDADVLVGTIQPNLDNERVITDTTSITWDIGTANQAKANVVTEFVQDVVGAFTTDSTTVNFTYDDGANTLTGAVISQMSITADASGIKLVSDSAAPGNNKVYGTDGSGNKGWQSAGAGSDKAPMTPQGRLTLTTATPVLVADAAAQQTIYYTPYVGDAVPIYDGSSWSNTAFTELSLALAGSANWVSGSNYDLFVINDSGTLRLATGTAWTNDTTRSSDTITRLNGVWVNSTTHTMRYGASSTVSVTANRGTYVGTVRMSASGTTTWEIGGAAGNGDEIRLFLWNCYNRIMGGFACRDTTDSWTYGTASWAALNASNTNRASFVRGLNEDGVWGDLSLTIAPPSGSNAAAGVGLDSTSALWTNSSVGVANATAAQNAAAASCAYSGAPGLGFHFVQALQYAAAASGTFYGDAGVTYFQEALTFNGTF